MGTRPELGTASAVIDANGNGSARWTVPGTSGAWTINRMAATGTSSSGLLLVTKNGTLIDTTRAPAADVSEPTGSPILVYPGEVIGAEWRLCTPGTTMTLTIEAQVEDDD